MGENLSAQPFQCLYIFVGWDFPLFDSIVFFLILLLSIWRSLYVFITYLSSCGSRNKTLPLDLSMAFLLLTNFNTKNSYDFNDLFHVEITQMTLSSPDFVLLPAFWDICLNGVWHFEFNIVIRNFLSFHLCVSFWTSLFLMAAPFSRSFWLKLMSHIWILPSSIIQSINAKS